MKPLSKLLLASALFLASASTALAGDDFGIWSEVTLEKKVGKKVAFDLGIDFRAEDHLKSAARWGASLGVSYKPARWFKMSGGYAYLYDHSLQEAEAKLKDNGNLKGYNVDHGYWRSRHRFWVDLTGKVEVGRVTFSLRERYLYTLTPATTCRESKFREPATGGYEGDVYTFNGQDFTKYSVEVDDKKRKHTHYLRSRLTVDWNIRHCPVDPFVSYELCNNLSEGFALNKTRLSVGFDWSIAKPHKLSVAYIYQNGHDDDGDNDIHVLSLGYKFTF